MASPITVQAKAQELFKLLAPQRSTNVMQRVQSYVVSTTGMKLSEFLGSLDKKDEEKHPVLDYLLTVARPGDWDKLPAPPSGQAQQAAPAVSTPPKPTTVPAPEPTPEPEVVAEIHDPVVHPVTEEVAPPADVVAAPAPVLPEVKIAQVSKAKREEKKAAVAATESDELRTALMNLALALEKKNPPTVLQTVDENMVRLIVRKELADLFTTIAGVIGK